MSTERTYLTESTENYFPQGGAQRRQIARRQKRGTRWLLLFRVAIMVAIVALSALLFNIVDQAFGYVAFRNTVEPETLTVGEISVQEQSAEQLADLLREHVSAGVLRRLELEQPLADRSQEELYTLVLERIIKPEVIATWTLSQSLFNRNEIAAYAREHPAERVMFRSWVSLRFLKSPQSSVPAAAGVRTALLGSLWMIVMTIALAFPLGVGAAIYLEEYAKNNAINRIIQVNINNLAGVPSIIYGILGLAIFVRALSSLTGGAVFGYGDGSSANGRTILSAGLTLALLVLPLIVISAQEAIRAVPQSLRHASLALGATKWQTIRHHVLPGAMPGILTGTILAMSRAMGETAPLVVVGASTFITMDPTSVFSRFTALPIQVYQWTTRPQAQFRHIAAAAIIVLMVMLLALNASAVLLRNRLGRRMRS